LKAIQAENKSLQERLQHKQRVINNKNKEIKRAKARRDSLLAESKKAQHLAKVRAIRTTKRLRRAREKLDELKDSSIGTVRLKEKGVVPAEIRSVVRQLVNSGVPEAKVDQVLGIVAGGLGLQLEGKISARTVGRIISAGGLAAQIQIVDEIQNSNGICALLYCYHQGIVSMHSILNT
jgi:hypothetical protein